MTDNMENTFVWLKEQGFMATPEQTAELLVANRGREDGEAAGSWVIDGNTSDATCRAILAAMENCDWDGPELRLGEWAGDPSFREILADLDIEIDDDDGNVEAEDDLFHIYSLAWYEGMQLEVERACLARIGGNDE